MTRPNDDRRLLARFRRRDRAAFDTLYDRYAGRLLAFALHQHRDGMRRLRPPPVLLQEDGAGDGPASGSPVEDAALASVALRRAIATLDESLREAFLLVAAHGLRHREAAEVIGAPVGTVKWRVAAATKRLRAALSEKESKEDEPRDVLEVHHG